jgi:hypothetical protein
MLWAASSAVRQSAQPWQRLRNHPLLWLQVAVATLLALTAARPFLSGAEQGRHVVVLLDASGSMRATDVAPDRFSVARAAVLDLARGLGPGESLSVVRMDHEPRLIIAGARTEGQVQAALQHETPAYGPADLVAAAAIAESVARGPAEWVLVGDGGIVVPEEMRRPPGTSFRFVEVGRSAGNVAVTSLSVREGSPGTLAIQAVLRNTGSSPVAGRLQLLGESELIGVREWSLEAMADGYVTWTGLAAGPAWFEARLSGVTPEANSLVHDDQAWAGAPRAGGAAALLVSSGNLFLERALTLDPRLRAFRVDPSDWPMLSAESPYAVTVFDGLWPEVLPRGGALIVGAPSGPEFVPNEIRPAANHPLLRHVDWSDVRVGSARRVPLDVIWETVIDSDGGPLLAVRTDGVARQAILTFSLSRTDLALRPAFPVLMANLLEWMLPALDPAPRSVPLGTALSLDASPLSEQVWVELPGGGREDLAPPWPPQSFYPPQPGVYRVMQAAAGGVEERIFTTNGYHPLEADLTPRQVSLPAVDEQAGPVAAAAFALWPIVAAMVLALSLLEWWFDARGR